MKLARIAMPLVALFSLTGCFNGTSVMNVGFSCATGVRTMDKNHFKFTCTKASGQSIYTFYIKDTSWDKIQVEVSVTNSEITQETFGFALVDASNETLYATAVTESTFATELSHNGAGKYRIAIQCKNYSGSYTFTWGA